MSLHLCLYQYNSACRPACLATCLLQRSPSTGAAISVMSPWSIQLSVLCFSACSTAGLLGYLLFQQLIERGYSWVWVLELIPSFALYRGLYEFAQYAFKAGFGVRESVTLSHHWFICSSIGSSAVQSHSCLRPSRCTPAVFALVRPVAFTGLEARPRAWVIGLAVSCAVCNSVFGLHFEQPVLVPLQNGDGLSFKNINDGYNGK